MKLNSQANKGTDLAAMHRGCVFQYGLHVNFTHVLFIRITNVLSAILGHHEKFLI